jgi:hypothetical protein
MLEIEILLVSGRVEGNSRRTTCAKFFDLLMASCF